MATTSKLSFRNRNLDANRGMRVFFADELPDLSECAPIARGVNPMPTGMEKEEEMETHLQTAISAQQASTSGISDSHVIPTPKVLYIDEVRYDQVYPVQPPCRPQLMRVQAWLAMEREEAEYDMDSEDEEYLRDKPHISSRDLESIMEKLEAQSSESAICQPATARKVLMPQFDDNVIDDVYDYWLSKRKDAAEKKILGFGGLIPRIRTECRKENEKLNPYVAFRRRAEKMQTRKNRKNDEDSYEKVLRLGHDLRRAVHLFEMVKRREKSKLAMLELDYEILDSRARMGDYGSVVYNQILARLQPEEESPQPQQPSELRVPPIGAAAADPALQPLRGEENGVKRKKMRKRASGLSASFDRDHISAAWLKKNAEVWNSSPNAFISGINNTYTPAVEQVDQSVAAANTANLDGRYSFKRKRGAYYRAPAPLRNQNTTKPPLSSIAPEKRFHYVQLPPSTSRDEQPSTSRASAAESEESTATTSSSSHAAPPKALLRPRIGRGGRMIFDLFPRATSLRSAGGGERRRNRYVAGRTSSVIYDPFELDCVAMDSEETSKWQARRRPTMIVDDDEDEDDFSSPPVSSRYLHSRRYRSTCRPEDEQAAEDEAEAHWLASAISPSPSPEPRRRPTADSPPPAKQRRPAPDAEPGDNDDPSSTPSGSTSGSVSHETTHEEEEGYESTPPIENPRSNKNAHDDDDRLSDVVSCGEYAAPSRNGSGRGGGKSVARSRVVQRQQEEEEAAEDEEHDETMDSIEDSPTSSSETDGHTTTHPVHLPLPLGVGAGGGRGRGAVTAAAIHQQLHLASGNASVLSPPDSTAPSPRVSNGSSNGNGMGSGSTASAHPMAASAAPAPHSNGHNGHAGSGNGVASGYEAAADHASGDATAPDAWRVRAKLVTMEAVASRLTRVKDPDVSSRESGCSPTEKSLPSPDGVEGGVVVQLVEPWEPSNSPSESNSSSDYTPPASTRNSGDVDARLSAYATLSSEEESGARTGDHPTLPAKPSRKQNGVTSVQHVQQPLGGLQRSFALAAATTTP